MALEIPDGRLGDLVNAVLARLPAADRAAVEATVRVIADDLTDGGLGWTTADTTPGDRMIWARVSLAPRLADAPPAVARYVVAHELAHGVLRHAQLMSALVCDLVFERTRDPLAWDAMRLTTETAATLQVVLWDFGAEYAAYLAAYPNAARLSGW